MGKANFKTIDEYISTFPEDIQIILEKIRQTINDAAPGLEEAISYQIPAFKLNGTSLIYFAGWKKHIGIYPISDVIKENFRKEFTGLKTSKGTVQFPLNKPMPLSLIKKIVKYKVKEPAVVNISKVK